MQIIVKCPNNGHIVFICLIFSENEVELSSDDEVEEYETSGKSYEGYYRRVRREMEHCEDSDESDFDS